MRKFFSLIAAVLFAGSMMADVVTILPGDFTAVENSDYSTTKEGVTVAVTASTVTADQMRIFKGKTITISAESNITSIEFTCTANGSAKYGPGSFGTLDGYTYEAEGKVGTWTGSATSVTFTATNNQVRATQIVVTLDDGGSVTPPVEETPAEKLAAYIADLTTLRDFVAQYVEYVEGAQDVVNQLNQYISVGNQALQFGNEMLIQTALSTAEQNFNSVVNAALSQGKAFANTQLDGLLAEAGDNEECAQIVANAKALIDAIAWDYTKSVQANLDAIQTQSQAIVAGAMTQIEAALSGGGDTPIEGDAESVDFSAQGYENQQAIESYSGTNFTVTFDKGTNSNAPKYYTSGTAIRCYGANSFTVASAKTIVKIVITFGSGDGSNEITAAPGTFATDTWTGSANSVVFTIGGTSGQRRIKAIEVTFGEETELTPAEKLAAYIADLTLIRDLVAKYADYVEGAQDVVDQLNNYISIGQQALDSGNDTYIQMALNAADQNLKKVIDEALGKGKEYAIAELDKLLAEVSDNEECVQIIADAKALVEAIAWDDTKSVQENLTALQSQSQEIIANAMDLIEKALSGGGETITCAAVYDLAKGDGVALNDVVVTFANGKNVWVKDATASMLIYLPASGSFAAGDVLSGVAGTVDIYNGVTEVKPSAEQVEAISATAGEAPAAEVVVAVATTDVNKYIVMQNVEAEGTFEEGKQSNLTINGVAVRNQFKNGYTFEAGKAYNVYGVVTIYQNNPQIYFISAEEAGGDTPIEPTVEYYVVGTMTNWEVDETYKLVANPANEGEFMGEFTFADQDELKIVGYDGETKTWYPDGMGNNYNISEQGGDYTVYFRPEGGVDGWYYGFFTLVEKSSGEESTEIIFTREDFIGQGTPNTGSEVTATKSGVTFTCSKAYCAEESLRCYAHGSITISAEATIEKILFTTTGGKTGGLDAEVTVDANSYEVADLASQARFTEIKVILGGGTTGIEETLEEGKAVKVLHEGQILIIKGDHTYTPMGQIVK